MNPVWTLSDYLTINGTRSIIEAADNMTKIRFADWAVSCAKDDVDLTVVRSKAEKAFDWWNCEY